MNRVSASALSRSTKTEIRARIRTEILRFTVDERLNCSERINQHLIRQRVWREARTILMYSPLTDEVNVWSLGLEALREGKIVGLPRFVEEDNSYSACRVEDLEESLDTGRFGIKEPRSDAPVIPLNQLDLVLVPAVAFDLYGARLGRGHGYYDRLLARICGIRCGVAFDQQIVDELPIEPHDVSMDVIVTPTRWMTFDQDLAAE